MPFCVLISVGDEKHEAERSHFCTYKIIIWGEGDNPWVLFHYFWSYKAYVNEKMCAVAYLHHLRPAGLNRQGWRPRWGPRRGTRRGPWHVHDWATGATVSAYTLPPPPLGAGHRPPGRTWEVRSHLVIRLTNLTIQKTDKYCTSFWLPCPDFVWGKRSLWSQAYQL